MVSKIFWGKKTPRRFVFGVGLYTIGYNLYDLCGSSLLHNTREPIDLKRYGKGNYAVITGASSATGQAYCEKLSKEGFKLILVDDCS